MISPNKKRVDISLTHETLALLDKVRGKYTRSEIIESAITLFVSVVAVEGNEKGTHSS